MFVITYSCLLVHCPKNNYIVAFLSPSCRVTREGEEAGVTKGAMARVRSTRWERRQGRGRREDTMGLRAATTRATGIT